MSVPDSCRNKRRFKNEFVDAALRGQSFATGMSGREPHSAHEPS